jgi:cyanophycin synthetase
VVGLDIAGVDVFADDISRPLARQEGAITAVHAGPELSIHPHSATEEPHPVGRAIVDYLFPDHETGRIPVVGITGSGGTTEVAHLVAEFLRLGGKSTGLACGDGLFFDHRKVEQGNCADWKFATRVLMNRSVEAAVLENSADVILGQGLAYDRCEVGVVTRIDPATHYGRFHITTPGKVFQIFRTQVDVVLPDGVAILNAADPMVADMESLCDGEVIFFAIDPSLPIITEHRSHGGRAVFVRGDEVILATAGEESPLVPVCDIPLIVGEVSSEPLENVLAAVAAAWALGIPLHVIRTGIQTYANAPEDSAQAGDPDPIFP